jgi:hypothetical protein
LATDAERRMIERDLHEGAQQRLRADVMRAWPVESGVGPGSCDEADGAGASCGVPPRPLASASRARALLQGRVALVSRERRPELIRRRRFGPEIQERPVRE